MASQIQITGDFKMSTLKIQKAFRKSQRSGIDTGEGMTEQCHKKECDMNYILRDYTRTGLIRHANENEGKYDDVSSADFQNAMFTVARVNSMFESLPGMMRKQFDNNASKFLEFVQNPNNYEEMRNMGILHGNDGIDIRGAQTMAPVRKEPEEATEPVVEPVVAPSP